MAETNSGKREGATLRRALARRDRHRQRPFVLRALTVVALILLVAASAEVWLRFGLLPPLLLPATIALLELEFAWAARLLAWGLERLARFARRSRRVPLRGDADARGAAATGTCRRRDR